MHGEDVRAALWLVPRPDTPLNDALQQIITGLRPLFDDGHKFQPHVTLTTGINVVTQAQVDAVLERAVAAARSVPYIDVVLQGPTYGSRFFRKVVLEVVPSAELVSLAMVCREMFVETPQLMSQTPNFDALSREDQDKLKSKLSEKAESWARAEYKPHLSLVYSNVYSVTEATRKTIDERLRDTFGPKYASKGLGWTNGRIALVDCTGEVEDWRVLGYRDIERH